MENNKTIFESILNTFENEDIKKFAESCLDAAPAYWHKVPASSTGKYHPDYALDDGGLARHTVALDRFLNHMFEVESIGSQFTSRERDLLRVAGLAHDMLKSGTQEEYEHSKWTRFDHPLLAARFIQTIDGLSKEEKIFIGMAISSHMGQWNTDKRHPDIVLPKPESKYQIILHLADYLASRKDIEMKFDNYSVEHKSETQTKELPDIATWRFDFGKHDGKTIKEAYEVDPGYIRWAKANMTKEPARSLLATFNLE